jgi:hypothetical protein
MDWIRSQNSQLHSLYAQLSDDSGPLDIPPGTTVLFVGLPAYPSLLGQMLEPIEGGGVVVRAGATPDDPNRGFVRYDLSTTDVGTPGVWKCKWWLTPPGQSSAQAFPEDGVMWLEIEGV